MDTVTAFCKSDAGRQGGGREVRGGGRLQARLDHLDHRRRGSPRGRHRAFVIDLLNIVPSFEHHYRAYGFWAPAVKDYQDRASWTQSGHTALQGVDEDRGAYEYRDRLTMPKYMINATGDQFFLPDSSQFYFDDLKGEKYLRYVPNTNH